MAEIFDILTVDDDTANDVVVPDATWLSIAKIDPIDRPAGKYRFETSIDAMFADTNDSAMFRFSNDGGLTWREFVKQAVDPTEHIPLYYAHLKNHQGGVVQLELQASKDVGALALTIKEAQVIISRVG